MYQFIKKHFYGIYDFLQLLTREQLEVDQYLIIARATTVDFLSHVPKLAGEHQLHLGMNVLYAVLNDKLASLAAGIDNLQFLEQHLQFIVGQEPD